MNKYEPGDFVLFEPKKEVSQLLRVEFPVKCQVNTINKYINSGLIGLTAFMPSGARIRFTAFAHQIRPLEEETGNESSEVESGPTRTPDVTKRIKH